MIYVAHYRLDYNDSYVAFKTRELALAQAAAWARNSAEEGGLSVSKYWYEECSPRIGTYVTNGGDEVIEVIEMALAEVADASLE